MLSLRLSTQLWKTSLMRNNLSLIRSLSSVPKEEKSKLIQKTAADLIEGEWKPIFKLPFIKQIAALNKLKIYQAVGTLVVCPISFALPTYIDPMVSFAIGATGVVTLTVISFVFNNVIGVIYTSLKSPEKVRFAYINMLGKRVDETVDISTVKLPQKLTIPIIKDAFCFVGFSNQKKKLKLSHVYGGVLDESHFYQIFGNIDE